MNFRVNFHNALDVNHGKIAFQAEDNEGLTPVSGNFTAYFGIVSPTGAVIADSSVAAGTFPGSGDFEEFYDIPFGTDNLFVAGEYTLVGIVRDGATLIATKTSTFDYAPHVVKSAAGLLSSAAIAVLNVVVSCSADTITMSDDTDHTDWTVTDTEFGVTPAPTAATPSPVEDLGAVYSFPADGLYNLRMSVERSFQTIFAGDPELTVNVYEKIVQLNPLTVNCAQACDLAGCVKTFYDGINNCDCGGDFELMSKEKMGAAIKLLLESVGYLLADKCGNTDLANTFFTNSGAPDNCGCEC